MWPYRWQITAYFAFGFKQSQQKLSKVLVISFKVRGISRRTSKWQFKVAGTDKIQRITQNCHFEPLLARNPFKDHRFEKPIFRIYLYNYYLSLIHHKQKEDNDEKHSQLVRYIGSINDTFILWRGWLWVLLKAKSLVCQNGRHLLIVRPLLPKVSCADLAAG